MKLKVLAVATLATLAGCASPVPPQPSAMPLAYDPANPGPWCSHAANLFLSPGISEDRQVVLYQMMRDADCYGLGAP